MNDAVGVGRLHRRQDLLHDVNHLGQGNRVVVLDIGLEVGPLDVLHHHVLEAVFLAGVEDPNNMGIVQLGG